MFVRPGRPRAVAGADGVRGYYDSAAICQRIKGDEVKARLAKQWKSLATEVEGTLKNTAAQAPTRETERRFAVLMQQAQQLRSRLYEAALQALLKEAIR